LLLLCDEATKPREIERPLPSQLRSAGDFAPLRHCLQLANFKSQDRDGLLCCAALDRRHDGARTALALGHTD
jgi:hypothetical protein